MTNSFVLCTWDSVTSSHETLIQHGPPLHKLWQMVRRWSLPRDRASFWLNWNVCWYLFLEPCIWVLHPDSILQNTDLPHWCSLMNYMKIMICSDISSTLSRQYTFSVASLLEYSSQHLLLINTLPRVQRLEAQMIHYMPPHDNRTTVYHELFLFFFLLWATGGSVRLNAGQRLSDKNSISIKWGLEREGFSFMTEFDPSFKKWLEKSRIDRYNSPDWKGVIVINGEYSG